MSDEATVLTDEADGVLVITINRPEAKNAVNLSVAQGVAAALERLDSDDSLRVGVLTGAGGTFCAGMDLKAFVSGEFPHIEGRGFGGMTERSADKPLIAAVEGYALAGGCAHGVRRDARQPALPRHHRDRLAVAAVHRRTRHGASGLENAALHEPREHGPFDQERFEGEEAARRRCLLVCLARRPARSRCACGAEHQAAFRQRHHARLQTARESHVEAADARGRRPRPVDCSARERQGCHG